MSALSFAYNMGKGNTARTAGRWEKAIAHYEKALTSGADGIVRADVYAICMESYGESLEGAARYPEALDVFETIASEAGKRGEDRAELDALWMARRASLSAADYAAEYRVLSRMIILAESIGDRQERANVHGMLGARLWKREEGALALEHFLVSEELSTQIDDADSAEQARDFIKRIRTAMGRY